MGLIRRNGCPDQLPFLEVWTLTTAHSILPRWYGAARPTPAASVYLLYASTFAYARKMVENSRTNCPIRHSRRDKLQFLLPVLHVLYMLMARPIASAVGGWPSLPTHHSRRARIPIGMLQTSLFGGVLQVKTRKSRCENRLQIEFGKLKRVRRPRGQPARTRLQAAPQFEAAGIAPEPHFKPHDEPCGKSAMDANVN